MNLAELKNYPSNIPAERAFLASILEYKDIMYTTKVKTDMFFWELERNVYKAICELRQSDRNIDIPMVHWKLSEEFKEQIREIPLCDHYFTKSNEYETEIIEKYTQRKLIKLWSDITNLAFESVNFDKIRQITSGVMMEWIQDDKKTFTETFYETVDTLGKRWDKICDFWYQWLNNMKGYVEWNLIIIWARPKVWKSAFALNLIDRIATQWIKSVLFSLEMNKAEIAERYISLYSRTSSYRLDYVTEEEKKHISKKAVEKIESIELMQVVDNIYKAEDIYLNIRRYAHDWHKIIFIDYLQLIQVDWKETKNDKIWSITSMLKRLASELKIAIVCLAQLNRDAANNTPELHNLRDSWNIEQDANIVFFLHQREEWELVIIVWANRSWPTFEIDTLYKKEFYTITDKSNDRN